MGDVLYDKDWLQGTSAPSTIDNRFKDFVSAQLNFQGLANNLTVTRPPMTTVASGVTKWDWASLATVEVLGVAVVSYSVSTITLAAGASAVGFGIDQTQAVSFSSTAAFTGDFTVASTASFSQPVDFVSTVTISGATVITSTASFTQPVTMTSTVVVTGDATFSSTASFSQPVDFVSTVSFAEPVAIASTLTVAANNPIIPSALTGTPVQHGIYRGMVISAWAVVSITGSAVGLGDGTFNISSIVSNARGDYTLGFSRNFTVDDGYVIAGTVIGNGLIDPSSGAVLAGSCRYKTINTNAASFDSAHYVMFIGNQ